MKGLVRWLGILVGVVLVAWLSYRLGQGNLFSQSNRTAPSGAELLADIEAPSDWTVHEDAAGFQVALPPGWQARADGQTGKAVISGPQGDQVVIWPVFTPSNGQGQGGDAGPLVLAQLSRKVFPRAQWNQPEMIGREAARQFGSEGASPITASFVWAQSPRGVAGTFYCVRSRVNGDEETQEMFARILESFRVAGSQEGGEDQSGTGNGPREGSMPSFTYTRWMDPKESAFSLEVPSGWRMDGGLFRLAPTDTRPAFVLTSPDGAIRITGGDQRIPKFAVPNQTLAWTGFTEGKMYSPGYGVNLMVRRYVPGTQFAAEYAQGYAQNCGNFRVEGGRDRPDAVAEINRIARQYAVGEMSSQMTAGEVKFTCQGQNGPMRGYYYATTQLTEGYGMGQWSVEYLYGYIAPPDREGEARQVISHMLQTVELNPQWMAMQQGITANTSRVVSETNRVVTEMMSKSFDDTQARMDEVSRKRSNANRGVVDVIDDATGMETQVQSGSNYYWIDHRGNIAGTDVYNRPSIDFRELTQRP